MRSLYELLTNPSSSFFQKLFRPRLLQFWHQPHHEKLENGKNEMFVHIRIAQNIQPSAHLGKLDFPVGIRKVRFSRQGRQEVEDGVGTGCLDGTHFSGRGRRFRIGRKRVGGEEAAADCAQQGRDVGDIE